MSFQKERREWLKQAAVVVAAVPTVGAFLSACTKSGSPLPDGASSLSETDPTAQALGYMHDASKVDTTKFPKKAEGNQTCANCAQFTSVNDGWGRCNIFPQGLVANGGWCNSWVPKT